MATTRPTCADDCADDQLVSAVVEYVTRKLPGRSCKRVTLKLDGDSGKVRIPIRRSKLQAMAANNKFIPTPNQQSMLEALNGVALTTDALANKAGIDRRVVHRKPLGGIHELIDQGLAGHHPRLGYYSTEFPDPQIADE